MSAASEIPAGPDVLTVETEGVADEFADGIVGAGSDNRVRLGVVEPGARERSVAIDGR